MAPETEQEIYTMDELIKVFNIERISKSPAIFDIDKLTWMNGMYLRNMDEETYFETVRPYLEEGIHSIYLKIPGWTMHQIPAWKQEP